MVMTIVVVHNGKGALKSIVLCPHDCYHSSTMRIRVHAGTCDIHMSHVIVWCVGLVM